MKYKTLALLALFITLVFGSGITYSVFHSNVSASGNQEIAQFIFQTEKTNHLELSLLDLNPGDTNTFEFAVIFLTLFILFIAACVFTFPNELKK